MLAVKAAGSVEVSSCSPRWKAGRLSSLYRLRFPAAGDPDGTELTHLCGRGYNGSWEPGDDFRQESCARKISAKSRYFPSHVRAQEGGQFHQEEARCFSKETIAQQPRRLIIASDLPRQPLLSAESVNHVPGRFVSYVPGCSLATSTDSPQIAPILGTPGSAD